MPGRAFPWLAAYIASIVAANYAIGHLGTPPPFPGGPHTVPVWPGIAAPSGVLFAGLAFTFRDALHETAGAAVTIAAIAAGAALSALIDPQLAVASGVAFLVGELADLAVYAPLRERRWVLAVAASAVVGALVDSLLFLQLAGFGVAAFLAGQLIGKGWATLAAMAALIPARRALLPRHA